MKISFSLCCGGLIFLLLGSCISHRPGSDGFARADTNNDGKLSRKEISDAVIKAIFDKYDTNGDGKLSYEEWRASDEDACRSLFDRRDTNRDGYISLKEAKASADRDNFLQDLVEKIDLDGDGLISREEAAAYAREHGPLNF